MYYSLLRSEPAKYVWMCMQDSKFWKAEYVNQFWRILQTDANWQPYDVCECSCLQWICTVLSVCRSCKTLPHGALQINNTVCTYSVTCWRVRVTIVVVEKQQCVLCVVELHITVSCINNEWCTTIFLWEITSPVNMNRVWPSCNLLDVRQLLSLCDGSNDQTEFACHFFSWRKGINSYMLQINYLYL